MVGDVSGGEHVRQPVQGDGKVWVPNARCGNGDRQGSLVESLLPNQLGCRVLDGDTEAEYIGADVGSDGCPFHQDESLHLCHVGRGSSHQAFQAAIEPQAMFHHLFHVWH